MIDAEFFESYSLYRKCSFPLTATLDLRGIVVPAIQLECPNCQGVRTWSEVKPVRNRVGVSQTVPINHPLAYLRDGSLAAFTFVCYGCRQAAVTYLVYVSAIQTERATGERVTDNPSSPPSDPVGIALVNARIAAANNYIMKVGQWPRMALSLEPSLTKALGDDAEIYRKGRFCELQSYGIAAFAYYRRIVENMIGKLLDDIGDLLVGQEQADYRDKLEQLKDSKVAETKIWVVKDLLPVVLRKDGVNPLSILHQALSVGLHSQTDEVCLELAEAIRKSLERLVEAVHVEKEHGTAYAADMQKLMQKIDKAAKRSDP